MTKIPIQRGLANRIVDHVMATNSTTRAELRKKFIKNSEGKIRKELETLTTKGVLVEEPNGRISMNQENMK